MAAKFLKSTLLLVIKLVILAGSVFLLLTFCVFLKSRTAPSADELCARVRPGMTAEQVETATSVFEGWQILRSDGTMVISPHPYSVASPVCRVAIDATTHQVSSKTLGSVQQGDWPTL